MKISKKPLSIALMLTLALGAGCDKQIDAPRSTEPGQSVTAEVKSLSLDYTERELSVGERFSLRPTITPETATGAPLIWASSHSEVASVSASGEVVALAAGEATITVQVKARPEVIARCTVRVRTTPADGEESKDENPEKPNEGGSDTPNKPSEGGGSGQPSDGDKLGDTPNKPGEDSGSGQPSDGGKPKEDPKKPDEPKAIAVERVRLSVEEHTLALGEVFTLSHTIEPANATNRAVRWSSSRPEIASVSESGEVRALKAGEAVISVTTEDGAHRAECRVRIPEPVSPPKPHEPGVAVSAVSVELEPSELQVGRQLQMREVIIPSNASDRRVTWHLSNPEVATISPTGLMTARKVGSTRITVRSVDGGKEWTSREVYITPFQLGVGDQYLDLVGVNTQGAPTSLRQFAGEGHYTLVDFWGDWCYYCKLDLPKIKAIWDKYRASGLRVVGVSSGDSFTTHQQSVQRHGITWPQIVDKNDRSAFQRTYGITGFPHILLIDRRGKIVEWKISPREADNILQALLDSEGSL